MLKHPKINRICMITLVIMLILTPVYAWLATNGALEGEDHSGDYAEKLFDPSKVHTIDIVLDDPEGFLKTCPEKNYHVCSLVIDGEKYSKAGIRGKGHSSLRAVEVSGSRRYSFKIEFDHYQNGKSYYGLDKLCLNNSLADLTYMKEYLAYAMMNRMGVPAPLCSFVRVSINGEYQGLYNAVEAVEEGFLSRNHLTGPARKLYKPRSTDVSADALLQYIDDDPASYPNIFDNAKTEITEEDKARLIGILKNLREGTDIESAVDTEEVIRYFAVHSFLVNVYSYTGPKVRNYYLYEDSGMLRMIPWNYNLACMELKTDLSEAATVSASVNYAIDTPVTGPGILARPILAWIFSDETYTDRYHEVYREFMESVYDSGWLQEEIGTVAEMISSYLENDPTAFYSYEEFQKGVETLKEFFSLRCQSVEGQLDGSIPSTAEGQKQNRSALVDASSIDLKYLGRPQDKDKGSDDGSSASDQTGTGSEMTEEDDAQALTWFGISAAVLAVALIFAMRKRICR